MIENDKNSEEIIGQLTGLYQKDPEEFEKMRSLLIEQTIQEEEIGRFVRQALVLVP